MDSKKFINGDSVFTPSGEIASISFSLLSNEQVKKIFIKNISTFLIEKTNSN